MHLGSITRFKRAAGIKPNMDSAYFSFNLSNSRQKGQAQSIDILICCKIMLLNDEITNLLVFAAQAESVLKQNIW